MKERVLEAWRAELRARLDRLAASQAEARSGTRVDGSHRPANRGERAAVTSAGYLALGLGQRAAELAEALRLLDEVGVEARQRVAVGALVTVDEGGESWLLAILPGGDATRLDVDEATVTVLSAQAPLVRCLLGLEEGDEGVFLAPSGRRELVVSELR